MMTGNNKNGTKRSLWQRVVSMLMAFAMALSFVPTAAFGSAMTADAADSATTLYLTPNSNWKVDNARFAAYFFGNGEKWVSMEECPNDAGVYRVDAPAGYPNVIFVRMNPGTTANNWDNKWNQTADLVVPTGDENCHTVPEGAWNGSSGWSVFTETPSVYNVTFNGTNVTSSGAATVTEGETYTATLSADEGYLLPETVTVTVGGIGYTSFTYADGVLTIPAEGVTGDIVITAVGVEEPQDKVLYLVPNGNWKQANARFAAYFFGSGDTWVGMTDADNDGVYEVTAPEGYPNVIFVRMNPGTTANNWDNKWNQTADLVVPTDDKNCYTVAEGAWDNGGGSWSVYTPAAAPASYAVTFNGTHVTSNGAPAALAGEVYTADLTADDGYTLPESVTVTVGGDDYTGFTYIDGVLTIPAAGVTGDIVITAVGVEEPDTITVYFRNDWLWPEVSVHYWGSTTSPASTWPGAAMTLVEQVGGYDMYSAEIPADVTAIIFNGVKNDGSGNRDQTPDVVADELDDGNAYTVYWNEGTHWKRIEYTPSSGGGEGGGDETVDYYLIGFINGVDYGFGDDWENLGDYKFVDGTLTATFTQDSYVFLKTGDNANWFMTEEYCEETTAMFLNTTTGASQKMKVPGGKELTFTLVENPAGSLTLSYVAAVPPTYIIAGASGLCGNEWDPSYDVNTMTDEDNDGVYEKVFTNVAAGSYEFKVTDGSWSNSWGANGGNATVTVDEDGSTVTIRFDAATKQITTEVTAPGAGGDDDDESTEYTAIFHFANTIGWSPLNLYVWNDDGATLGSWPGSA
ncbi:MAG: starch-binding protein, partial [Clostridia bacterium]|nr:starch-binding protein [Clostridia bacterium]